MPLYIKYVRGFYVKDYRDGKGPVVTSRGLQIVRTMHRLVEFFGPNPIAEFDTGHLELIRDDFVSSGFCRGTVNSYIEHIRRFFRWAADRKYVPSSVYHDLKLMPSLKPGRTIAPDHPKVRIVSDETLESILAHVRLPMVRDMLRLQSITGMRPGEVRMMRLSEIDRSREDSDGIWIYRPQTHKTVHMDEYRTVVLGPRAIEILRRYAGRMKSGQDFIFLNRAKNPYTGPLYARLFRDARVRAGLPDAKITPNVMRHKKATEVRAQYGLEAAQVVLGHKSRDTTERYYAEISLDEAIRAAREIG